MVSELPSDWEGIAFPVRRIHLSTGELLQPQTVQQSDIFSDIFAALFSSFPDKKSNEPPPPTNRKKVGAPTVTESKTKMKKEQCYFTGLRSCMIV